MIKNLIIIPTYNEVENIDLIIEAILSLDTPYAILIVDDNSPDGTADVVKALQKKYPSDRLFMEQRINKQGLGTAYLHGFKWALKRNYEYIFEMDADFSHNPNDLDKLYAACKNDNFGVTIGSRYIKGVNVVNWSLKRVLLSYCASIYVRIITGMKIKDSTAGFVCYQRSVLETIDLDSIRCVGYAFQIEMKFKAWVHGFKIKEVSVVFVDRVRGKSKLNISIIKESIWGVFTMKLKHMLNW